MKKLLIIIAAVVVVALFYWPFTNSQKEAGTAATAKETLAARVQWEKQQLEAESEAESRKPQPDPARVRYEQEQVRSEPPQTSHAPIAGYDAETAALAGVITKTVELLGDPRSLQVSDLYIKNTANAAVGCMEYRSRNGFGGYVAGHATWAYSKTFQFAADDVALWNRWCIGTGFTNKKDQIPKIEEWARTR